MSTAASGLGRRRRQRRVSRLPQITVVGDAAEEGADDVGEGEGAEHQEEDAAGVQLEGAGGRGVGHAGLSLLLA